MTNLNEQKKVQWNSTKKKQEQKFDWSRTITGQKKMLSLSNLSRKLAPHSELSPLYRNEIPFYSPRYIKVILNRILTVEKSLFGHILPKKREKKTFFFSKNVYFLYSTKYCAHQQAARERTIIYSHLYY